MKRRNKIFLGVLSVLAIALAAFGIALSHNAACPPTQSSTSADGTMRAAIARCYGDVDVIEIARVEKPVPAPGDVLIRVHSAGLNPLDWHFLRGEPYVLRLAEGFGRPDDVRMGVDFAGVVEAVGAEVDEFAPGDEVFGGGWGAFAEYLTVPAAYAVAEKPGNVGFDEAAGVSIAAITALQALSDKAGVKSGDRVLINGASGGVGTYAVQIAKALGAHVTGVCSARNVELVRSLGADEVIDYTRDDVTERDERYDVVIDMVGNHSPGKLVDIMTPEGRLVLVGGLKGPWIGPFVRPLQALLLAPFTDREIVTLFAVNRKEDLQTIGRMMADGEVRTVIDRHYPLAELDDAIGYLATRRARGKVIVTVSETVAQP